MDRPKKEDKQVVINKPKRKHPLLKAFDEDSYWVSPWDGGYCLYDKKMYCKRANAQYLGQFYISTNGDKYVFRSERYDSKETLIEAMDKYNATLPFSPEIYDPINRKNYSIEIAVTDYLTGIGFKRGEYHGKGERFYFSDTFGQHICEIELRTKFDTSTGKVLRRIITTDKKEMWQESPFINLETAISAVNSIVAGYLAVVQAQLMNSLKALTKSRAAVVLNQTLNISSLSILTEDATKQTIEFLEEELKRLKEE